ncbi:MAG: MoxR family ATPase [Chloroflexi bacterium]|nr:MoxR family ATPase [Chloroflexota bacterium]
MANLFDTTATVKSELNRKNYIASDEIATIVYLAQKLGKPLLAEGPAGVGKTELAKAIAAATGRELIRLQCYEGLDESKALYEWEYSKQLLYTQLLRDKLNDTLGKAESLSEAADKLAKEEDVFFSERFLLERPLLKAILSDAPTVLLIDEIDRADAEFEAFLLEVLSDFQVSVPELGTLAAKHKPFVVLTSNNTRELSEALKRRCLYLFIDYPTLQEELAVVRLKVPDLNPKLAQQAVEFVQRLRKADMRKSPSISETLDWANALLALNASSLDKDVLEDTLSVLLKHEADLQKIQAQTNENSRHFVEIEKKLRPQRFFPGCHHARGGAAIVLRVVFISFIPLFTYGRKLSLRRPFRENRIGRNDCGLSPFWGAPCAEQTGALEI